LSAGLRRSFASLSVPNYRLYFGGQIVSLAGNWMQIVAELWLILTLTDSGVYVGLATALQFAGILVFGALGGSLADRFDKRKLLMISQTAMAVPATVLFLLAATGAAEAWMVLAVIGLRGLVLSVDNPARQAFVIEIVGPERVVNAVGLNSVLIHSARITGPAIAGGIIALWGVAPCFAVNALSFVAMLIALWRMDPSKLRRPEARRRRGGVRHALRYVADTPELRVPLLLMLVLGTLGFNFQVIIPLLADRSFGGDVSAYSLMMIAMGVGSIAGALIVGARNQASKQLIAGAALGFGVASFLAAAAPTLALEMAALVLLGLASVTFAAGINSGLQLAAAPEMRGRVMALYSIVFLGSTPIGGPLTGWIGETVSPRASLALAGVTAVAVAAAAALAWRERRRPADAIERRRAPRRLRGEHGLATEPSAGRDRVQRRAGDSVGSAAE
jgi:MFS family permease